MKELGERNVLLTGGSRGLGPVIGRALAREGANVALSARSSDELDAVSRELTDLGVKAPVIPADISTRDACEALLTRAVAELGPIDVLVNNAGMEWICRYDNLSLERLETMVRTNLLGPLLLTRLLLPQMLERGSGHIVTMSSLGGKKGSPYSATYAGTKAALIEWTASLREELRGTGVSASVICPGFVSDVGMFAVYGKRAPKLAGESKPQDVAAAVIRAIRNDVGEIVVNPGSVKLMAILDAVSPRLMSWILRRGGVYDFYREQSEDNEKAGGDLK